MSLLEAISPTARKLLKAEIPLRRAHVLQTVANHAARMFASNPRESDDVKLVTLVTLLGQLAQFIHYGRQPLTGKPLICLTAHLIGWIECRSRRRMSVLVMIHNERERQNALRRAHPEKYLVDVAHPQPDLRRKLRVLFEEAGEVAREIDALEQGRPGAAARLVEELVQTAAVAVAWLESYEVAS